MSVIANFFAQHHACAILAANGIGRRDGMDRLEQLRLLGTYGIGVE